MKKLAYAATAVATLFAFATPAVANDWWTPPQDTLEVKNIHTDTTNMVLTLGNSGLNFTSGGDVTTGKAEAIASVSNSVNFTGIAGCGCFDDIHIGNYGTDTNNYIFTVANSGLNFTSEVKHDYKPSLYGGGWSQGGSDVRTGAAYAKSVITNDINTTVVGDFGN